MLKLKKTAVAVLALGSSAVFAGTMGPVCTPGNVTVPCERSAWDFAGQGLYLQPSLSSLDYFGSTTVTNATGGTNEVYQKVNAKWAWGFMIEGSYHFSTGNDVDLNWYHWNNTVTQTPLTSLTDFNGNIYTGTAFAYRNKPQWDAVNLEFGQHFDFSPMASARMHAGFEYARIHNQGSAAATTTTTPVGTSIVATAGNSNQTYNGFGARVGGDLVYGWGNGLSVYGKSAGSLLAGSRKFDTAVTAVSAAHPAGQIFTQSGSVAAVVPVLEAKLGAMYTYAMAQGDISLDAGWMWINYFSATEIGTTDATTIVSDFALQGPYVGLKWIGNVV